MGPILTPDAPLSRLPRGLDAAQRNWLEGIRYSVEIVDLAYHRLAAVLGELSDRISGPGEVPVESYIYASVLLDAWTVVDASWRLKRFILDSRMPRPPGPPAAKEGAQPKAIRARMFAEAVKPMKQLRDGFQHLDNKVLEAAGVRQPVWGYVNWVKIYPLDHRMHSCSLVPSVPGIGTSRFDLINPVGRRFHSEVDHVTLSAFQTSADLSALHRIIRDLAGQLNEMLRPYVQGLPAGGDSFILGLTLRATTNSFAESHAPIDDGGPECSETSDPSDDPDRRR